MNSLLHPDVQARFWSKVDVPRHRYYRDHCWEWTAQKCSRGYGKFGGAPGLTKEANRWSYFFANGKWPEHEAGHTCHNPGCVNPHHLEDVTRLRNEQQKDEAGRRPRGVKGLPCPKCGGPQEGRSKRGKGSDQEFAFCIPCRREFMRDYMRQRRSSLT